MPANRGGGGRGRGAIGRKKGLIKKGTEGLDDLSASDGEQQEHTKEEGQSSGFISFGSSGAVLGHSRDETEEPAKKRARPDEVPKSLQQRQVSYGKRSSASKALEAALSQSQREGEDEGGTEGVIRFSFDAKEEKDTTSFEESLFQEWSNWVTVKKCLTSGVGGSSTTALGKTEKDIAVASDLIKSWEQRSWRGRPTFVQKSSSRSNHQQQGRIFGGLQVPGYITATLTLVKALNKDQKFLAQSSAISSGAKAAPRLSPSGGLMPLDVRVAAPAAAASTTSTPPLTSEMVVNEYCISISRSVQIMQSSGFGDEVSGGDTYRSRAQAIGMPEEAIEIRNEVAHGTSLPGLTQLRWVCGLVLDWLYETYWLAQEKELGKIRQVRKAQASEKVVAEKVEENKSKAAVTALLEGKGSATSVTSKPAAPKKASAEAPAVVPGGGLSLAQLKARLSGGESVSAQEGPSSSSKVEGPSSGPVFEAVAPGSAWKVLRKMKE